MSAEDNAGSVGDKPTGRERGRISFPYDDLAAAVEVASKVHETYGGSCDTDQLAAALSQKVNSGGFRSKISTAKMFGFLSPERGVIEATDLGRRAASGDVDALADAFLNVPLYLALYEAYRGTTIPGPQGLEAKMRALGVPVKSTQVARQMFSRSAEQAGFHASGTNRLVKPPRSRGSEASAKSADKTEEKRDERGGKGHDGFDMQQHPLLVGLWRMLPSPEEGFSEEDRRLWLRAADMNLALLYRGKAALPEDLDTANR